MSNAVAGLEHCRAGCRVRSKGDVDWSRDCLKGVMVVVAVLSCFSSTNIHSTYVKRLSSIGKVTVSSHAVQEERA